MKFRIYGDHLRVRLTQSEVTRLGVGQKVEQTTHFAANSKLVSCVEPSAEVLVATVVFDGASLRVTLPLEETKRWASSTQVGIQADQAIGHDRSLRLLIEKDFECLHKDEEQTPDAYPNPRSE